MKKRIIGMLCVATLTLTTNTQASQINTQVYLEGERLEDVQPLTIDYSTYLPVRGFFEKLDAQISWDQNMKNVTIVSSGKVIILTVDSLEVTINGEIVQLNTPAQIKDGHVIIPLRFISENLGFYLEWVKESNSVYVYSNIEGIAQSLEEQSKSGVLSLIKASESQYILTGVQKDKLKISQEENTITIGVSGASIHQNDIETLKSNYVVGVENIINGEDSTIKLTLKDNVRMSLRTVSHGIGLVFGDVAEIKELEIAEGITYSVEGHPIIRINKVQIDTNKIKIDDNYSKKIIDIDLNSYQGDLIKVGRIVGADSYINSLDITHGQTTKIRISEKSIQAVKVVEQENVIEFHLLRPRQVYDKIVVLDVGHGGTDGGASGNGVVEKSINLKQALGVKEMLEEDTDIKVYMTRETDNTLKLSERTNFSNGINPHIFISFHNNSSGSQTAQGSEVLYNPTSEISKTAANMMLKHIIDETNFVNRGIKARKDLYVLNKTDTPAILLEVGFVSNKADAGKLKDEAFNKRIVSSIKEGIVDLFESLL